MPDKVRLGIVGLGEHALRHLGVLTHMPEVEVAALVSRSEERARDLAARFGVAATFAAIEDMLARVDLDAVYVLTEDSRHFAPVMAALDAGVDVFVEKPISTEPEEARRMVAEAERLGRRLMVGHILRFDPRCAAVKERVASGGLGRIATVYGRRNQCHFLLDQYSHACRFFATGIHDIDLGLWYLEGRRPVEAYMRALDVRGKGDDVFWGIVTMDDGSLVVLETSWILPAATPWRGHILLEVLGSEGAALAEVPGNALTFWSETQVEAPDTTYWPTVHGATVGALRDEDAYFVRCIREGREVEMPRPREALAALEVAHALVRSAAAGRALRL